MIDYEKLKRRIRLELDSDLKLGFYEKFIEVWNARSKNLKTNDEIYLNSPSVYDCLFASPMEMAKWMFHHITDSIDMNTKYIARIHGKVSCFNKIGVSSEELDDLTDWFVRNASMDGIMLYFGIKDISEYVMKCELCGTKIEHEFSFLDRFKKTHPVCLNCAKKITDSYTLYIRKGGK